MIETRKTEIRYVTSDPKKMLNMYLAKRVLKTWEESFIDEDTGETVTIERNEILFDRGTLIDQDTLAKIRFSMEADGIKEVEVSNQNRLAFENENKFLYPYLAQAQISDKKYKFLLYATGLENACLILKDYIELNYQFGFTLTMIKEFDSCVILTDNLKERKVDDASLAYLKMKSLWQNTLIRWTMRRKIATKNLNRMKRNSTRLRRKSHSRMGKMKTKGFRLLS